MDRKAAIATIASGAACALLVFAFTQSLQSQYAQDRAAALEQYGGQQVEVCVATADISAGEVPNASNTVTQMWVSGLLPSDPVESLSQVADKTVTTSIIAGEVLSYRHFDAVASEVDVPSGFSALSVPAEAVKAVGGAVSAGMRVDVYLAGSTSVKLLSEGALVLSTSTGGTDSSSASKEIAWITLAVPPESIQEFIAAAESGSLYFVMKGEAASEQDAGQDAGQGTEQDAAQDAGQDSQASQSEGNQQAASEQEEGK